MVHKVEKRILFENSRFINLLTYQEVFWKTLPENTTVWYNFRIFKPKEINIVNPKAESKILLAYPPSI